MQDGAYLGSEEQLLTKFKISRPTLRQAVRLLEHERLLVIKRGGGGGFYVRRPQIEAVAHAAAIYLGIERATPRDMFAASVPLLMEAVRLAACCKDEQLHTRLKALIKEGNVVSSTEEDFEVDVEFARIIGEMCGNPAINLFVSIIYEFGKNQWRNGLMTRIGSYSPDLREARTKLIHAILGRDAELAMLFCRRRSDLAFQLIGDMPGSLGPMQLERALSS
jgi:GntR family transcriptional repressor for pyruvate dehydrogenase complex